MYLHPQKYGPSTCKSVDVEADVDTDQCSYVLYNTSFCNLWMRIRMWIRMATGLFWPLSCFIVLFLLCEYLFLGLATVNCQTEPGCLTLLNSTLIDMHQLCQVGFKQQHIALSLFVQVEKLLNFTGAHNIECVNGAIPNSNKYNAVPIYYSITFPSVTIQLMLLYEITEGIWWQGNSPDATDEISTNQRIFNRQAIEIFLTCQSYPI